MGFSIVAGQLAKEFARKYDQGERWENVIEGPLFDKSGPNTVYQTNGKVIREILVVSAMRQNPRVIFSFPLHVEPCGNNYVLADSFSLMPDVILLHRPSVSAFRNVKEMPGWLGYIKPSNSEAFLKQCEEAMKTTRKNVTAVDFRKDRNRRQDDALYSDGFHSLASDNTKGMVFFYPSLLRKMGDFGGVLRGEDWETRRPING